MLIKLRNGVKLDDEKKTLLVLSNYNNEVSDLLMEQDKSFWNSTICFVDSLEKIRWELQNGLYDYLYIPLNKLHLVDRRLFNIL